MHRACAATGHSFRWVCLVAEAPDAPSSERDPWALQLWARQRMTRKSSVAAERELRYAGTMQYFRVPCIMRASCQLYNYVVHPAGQ